MGSRSRLEKPQGASAPPEMFSGGPSLSQSMPSAPGGGGMGGNMNQNMGGGPGGGGMGGNMNQNMGMGGNTPQPGGGGLPAGFNPASASLPMQMGGPNAGGGDHGFGQPPGINQPGFGQPDVMPAQPGGFMHHRRPTTPQRPVGPGGGGPGWQNKMGNKPGGPAAGKCPTCGK